MIDVLTLVELYDLIFQTFQFLIFVVPEWYDPSDIHMEISIKYMNWANVKADNAMIFRKMVNHIESEYDIEPYLYHVEAN